MVVVVELLVVLVLVEEIVVLVVVAQFGSHSQGLLQYAIILQLPAPQPVQDPVGLQPIAHLTYEYSVLLNIARRNINFKMFIVRP